MTPKIVGRTEREFETHQNHTIELIKIYAISVNFGSFLAVALFLFLPLNSSSSTINSGTLASTSVFSLRDCLWPLWPLRPRLPFASAIARVWSGERWCVFGGRRTRLRKQREIITHAVETKNIVFGARATVFIYVSPKREGPRI